MIVTLKIIHFLALAIGIGGGVANAVIGARMASVDASMRPVLGGISATIGKLGLAAIVLLWLTGVPLTYVLYDGWAGLPASFWLKIIFVVILTGLVVRLNMQTAAAKGSSGKVPDKSRALLGQMTSVASVLIVVFAALAFTV